MDEPRPQTTDLVARLRDNSARGWSEKDDLMVDAADEIERLRAEIRGYRAALHEIAINVAGYEDEDKPDWPTGNARFILRVLADRTKRHRERRDV